MLEVRTETAFNYTHKIIVNDEVLQKIETHDENSSIDYLVEKHGVLPNSKLLRELNRNDIFKRYDKVNKQGDVYHCLVSVNRDEYLRDIDEFEIVSNKKLPDKIVLYGKRNGEEDKIFVNYWLFSFPRRIKEGYLIKYEPSFMDEKEGLAIGLPYSFRSRYFYDCDTKKETAKELIKSLIV